MKMVLGLGHKARQGKDFLAKYLKERYGFEIMHFADALYHEVEQCEIVYSIATGLLDILLPFEEFNVMPTAEMERFMRSKGQKKNGWYVYKGGKRRCYSRAF